MDLDNMKYAQLRSLAKEVGLKAKPMKADKLLKELKQHYQQQQQRSEDDQEHTNDGIVAQDNNNSEERHVVPEEKPVETISKPVANTFVTKRRGRGGRPKRKISETETEADCDPELPLGAAKEDNEAPESSADNGSAGSAKRRRTRTMSPVKDSEAALPVEESVAIDNEEQAEIKEEAPVVCHTGNEVKVAKAGKIPRHEGLLKRNRAMLRPTTPNFKKLHEAHFNKMESIDSYVQRKTKRVESFSNSVKELKMLSKTIAKPTDGKPKAKASVSRTSLFSPVPAVQKRPAADQRRNTLLSASKPAKKEEAPFRPSVLSTRRINVRFSEATRDNEHKMSLVKTPARKSIGVSSSTPGRQASDTSRPNVIKTAGVSATKTPAFVFNANTSVLNANTSVLNANTSVNTPGTNKKSFDLKASLSRALSYKPHTGKLKPFGDAKENAAANKSVVSESTHQKNYKQHQVQTRDQRRAKHVDGRKQKKENILGARRGLVLT